MKRGKTLSDILIPGADWSVKKVDVNDPEIQKQMKECRDAQALCEERKKIDPLDLLIRMDI